MKVAIIGLVSIILLINIPVLNASELLRTNDNIAFDLNIKTHQQNSSLTDGRYRQTASVHNQWKVNMTESGECPNSNNCLTRFWLEKHGGQNVSKSVNTSVSEGSRYTEPYSSANGQTVYLTAENNTYDTNWSYDVSGYWDEEVW